MLRQPQETLPVQLGMLMVLLVDHPWPLR